MYAVERPQQTVEEGGDPQMVLCETEHRLVKTPGLQTFIGLAVIAEHSGQLSALIEKLQIAFFRLFGQCLAAMQGGRQFFHSPAAQFGGEASGIVGEVRPGDERSRHRRTVIHDFGTCQKYLHLPVVLKFRSTFLYIKLLCGADSTCKITFFLLNMQAFFLPIAPILLHHPAHQHFVFRKRAMSFVGFMFCARPLHHLCMGLAQVVQSLRAMRATAMHHSRC